MAMQHVVVPVPNRPGVMADVTERLSRAGINIENLQAASSGDVGIVTVAVDNPDEAMRVLREAGYRPVADETILIRLDNHAGAVADAAARLRDAGVNIRSMHFLDRNGNTALIGLVCDPAAVARETLKAFLVSWAKPA
jgi:hypothetical protein